MRILIIGKGLIALKCLKLLSKLDKNLLCGICGDLEMINYTNYNFPKKLIKLKISLEKKGNKIANTTNQRQKANEIGGTYSTPPLATIILVAINIGWTSSKIYGK